MSLETVVQVPIDPSLASAFTPGGLNIGPVKAYYADKLADPAPLLLTGTVTASASTTVTGTGTAFLSELKVNQFVQIGDLDPVRVVAITGDTELTVHTPVTAADDTIARAHLIYLGKTLSTVVEAQQGMADLMASQRGASPDDRSYNSYVCNIQAGFVELNSDQAAEVFPGLEITYNLDGSLKRINWLPLMGKRHRQITKTLYLVPIVNVFGKEQENPMFTWAFWEAAPNADGVSRTFNAADQDVHLTTFNAYLNDVKRAVFTLGDFT